MDYKLPYPLKEELTMTTKSDYFKRVIPMDLDKKYKITQDQLCEWISENFNSIYLSNKELTMNQHKKIK